MLYRMDESLFNTKLEYLNLLRRSDSDSVFSSAICKSELNIWLNLLLSPSCLLFTRGAKSQMTEDDSLSHELLSSSRVTFTGAWKWWLRWLSLTWTVELLTCHIYWSLKMTFPSVSHSKRVSLYITDWGWLSLTWTVELLTCHIYWSLKMTFPSVSHSKRVSLFINDVFAVKKYKIFCQFVSLNVENIFFTLQGPSNQLYISIFNKQTTLHYTTLHYTSQYNTKQQPVLNWGENEHLTKILLSVFTDRSSLFGDKSLIRPWRTFVHFVRILISRDIKYLA